MSFTELSRLYEIIDINIAQFVGLYKTPEWFKEWLIENLHIYQEFLKFALFLKQHGNRDHYGSRMIIERIRWETMLRESKLSGYKVNNTISPFLARLSMLDKAELMGMFETRERHDYLGDLF